MQRFRGGLVFQANTLSVSLNSMLEPDEEEKEEVGVKVEGVRASLGR